MLFPGSRSGVRDHIPWTVFTDPEVAQCGLSEADARTRFLGPQAVQVARWPLDRPDVWRRSATDGRRGPIGGDRQ